MASEIRNGGATVPAWSALPWLALALYEVALIALAGSPSPAGEVTAATGIAIAAAHAVLAYGWRDTLALLLICLAITYTIENIGIASGFPFGHYHFEVLPMLPHIGTVPFIVGPLYFGMGYMAWVIGGTLLDDAHRRLDQPFQIIALPIVAAFVMVQWDVVMDPPFATLGRAWIWHDGGGYFGVPLSNFLGWYLTVWLFFQAFSVYLYCRRRAGAARAAQRGRAFWLLPILLYLGVALSHAVPWLLRRGGDAVDGAGRHWDALALHETTATVMLFTMFFTSVLALLRWHMNGTKK